MNNKLLQIIIGIVLPPVGIFMTYGIGSTLLINILLTLLGWLPGSIHALWAINQYQEKLAQNEQQISN